MSDIVFIVQNKKREQGRQADIKLFTDVTIDIMHNFENDITDYKVERGADMNDHASCRSNTFTVNGIVANNSLERYTGNAISYSADKDRRQEMYNQLKRIRDNKLKFTLVTGYDSFENCMIQSFNVPVSADNSNVFTFSMNIKQIREAFTSSIDIVQAVVREDKKEDVTTTNPKGGNQAESPSVYEQIDKVITSAYKNLFTDEETTEEGGG